MILVVACSQKISELSRPLSCFHCWMILLLNCGPPQFVNIAFWIFWSLSPWSAHLFQTQQGETKNLTARGSIARWSHLGLDHVEGHPATKSACAAALLSFRASLFAPLLNKLLKILAFENETNIKEPSFGPIERFRQQNP